MKAYQVSCEDDDHAMTVVFAPSPSKAKQFDHRETCDCEFLKKRAVRAAGFDDLFPGPIKTEDYLSRGWSFPCGFGSCPKTLWLEDYPIMIGAYVFCNRECVARERDHWPVNTQKMHSSVIDLCSRLDDFLEAS